MEVWIVFDQTYTDHEGYHDHLVDVYATEAAAQERAAAENAAREDNSIHAFGVESKRVLGS